MLHFEGDTDFPQSPAEVFARLSDADFLARCIPGVEAVSRSAPAEAVCVLRPGLAFVRGTLEVTLKIVEAVEASSVRLHAHSKGIGSSNDVEGVLAFALQDGATRVRWSADVTNLTGLLKAVPQGLLKGAGQKVIADVWAAIQAKLGEPPP